jgi:hypothetical protein
MEDQEFARRMKLLEQKEKLYGADSEEVKAARKKLDEDCEGIMLRYSYYNLTLTFLPLLTAAASGDGKGTGI